MKGSQSEKHLCMVTWTCTKMSTNVYSKLIGGFICYVNKDTVVIYVYWIQSSLKWTTEVSQCIY